MYKTVMDQKREWNFLLSGVLVMLLLWGMTALTSMTAQAQVPPDVGNVIVVFSETYDLAEQERQDLTSVVADWLARNPALADQPIYIYQLIKRHQNVP